MSAALDLLLSSTIVATALAFLVLRFVRPRTKQVSGPADVLVGASLQRGLDKARRNKQRKK
jgi:hypothetical protein